MADYEYYGNATFQTLLEERDHDDKFVSEVIRMMGVMDADFADIMRRDILKGNTHTLRKFYRKSVGTSYEAVLFDGTLFDNRTQPHSPIDIDAYPMVPIKDDYTDTNNVASYADLDDHDSEKIAVDENLSSLNMDWEDIAQKIVDPDPITGGPDDPSFSDYKKQWEHSPSLQEQYPTLQAYYDQVVQDLQDQREHEEDISDIYIGIGATGDKLGEANVTAIYHTFSKILPQLTFAGYGAPQGDIDWSPYPKLAYAFEYKSGFFRVVCGMTEWSLIIRQGVVRDEWDAEGEPPRWKKGKCNHTFYSGRTDSRRVHTDGDPIVEIVRANPQDGTWQAGNVFTNSFTGLIEMQVQLTQDTYGELRMWDYGTMHIITNRYDDHQTVITGTIQAADNGDNPQIDNQVFTVTDGSTDIGTVTAEGYNGPSFEFAEGGDEAGFQIDSITGHITSLQPLDYATQNIYYLKVHVIDDEGLEDNFYVTINVLNTNSEPEPPEHPNPFEDDIDEAEHHGSDLIFFPMSMKATRKVEVFKRERLLRESVILNIYTVHREKIEWYQKGWFKIVMFILAIVLTALMNPGGLALLMNMQFVVTTALQLVIASVVVQMIANLVGAEAWIALALLAVAAVVTGYVNFSLPTNMDSFIALATKFMNAANVAIKAYYKHQMEELQKEMLEWQEKMEAAEKELDKLQEEAGGIIRSDASDLTTWLASVPEPEDPDTFFHRTLDVESNAIIDDTGRYSDPYNLFPPMIR